MKTKSFCKSGSTPTNNGRADEQRRGLCLQASCAGCEAGWVLIYSNETVSCLLTGERYGFTDLPVDLHGNRVVLCWDCLLQVQRIVQVEQAPIAVHILREANRENLSDRIDPDNVDELATNFDDLLPYYQRALRPRTSAPGPLSLERQDATK